MYAERCPWYLHTHSFWGEIWTWRAPCDGAGLMGDGLAFSQTHSTTEGWTDRCREKQGQFFFSISVLLLWFISVATFINLIVGHKASWFEVFLFVDHLCQILLLGKLFNQSSGVCSSGFTPVSYLHVTYANCMNLMEIAEKCLFRIIPQNQIKRILCIVTLFSWQMHFSLPNLFCSAKKKTQFDYCKIVALCFLKKLYIK